LSHTRVQLFCAWSGVAAVLLYLIFFWGVAGFIPPTDPTDTPGQLVSFYAHNRTDIRIGQIGGMIAATLFFPFFALVSMRIAKAEGDRVPLLAAIQFGAATLLLVFFAVCGMLWIAASFRPELDGSTVRALHDTGWLMFVMVFPGYSLQMICMAIAGFIDKSPTPTWPRWAAYLNLWVAFSGMGGGLAVFFKQGPFAWNGLIGFYLPIAVFAVWVGITTWLLVSAVKRDAAAEEAAGGAVRRPEPVGVGG